MRNKEVAQKFYELAALSELAGENTFRVRAYQQAAQAIENLPFPVEDLAEKEQLTSVKGIGKSIAGKIVQYLHTGHINKLEELKKKVPESLLEIERVPGLGAKRAKLLYERLGITTVEKLKKAAKEGKIRSLSGFGEKTEQKIIRGLSEMRNKRIERVSIGIALPLAESIVDELKLHAPVEKVEICGSIRRMKPTIGDVDILVVSNKPEVVIDKFSSLDVAKNVIIKGETKTSIFTYENLQVDLRVVQKESFGAAVQYFTGSKQHNIKIRELAIKKNLKVNEYGVFDLNTNERIAGETEESVYRALGLQWVPPEMREDTGEVEAAKLHKLPELIELKDIKGDIHMHTVYSDGVNTVEEMARRAMQLGRKYIAVSDHAKALGIANGLSIERYKKEKKEIENINKKLAPFKIFLSTELNILSDGSLDFPDDELTLFDICLAGIHTGMNQSKEKMTERTIRAMSHKAVRVIVHPTGAIINGRSGYELDMDKVFEAGRKFNTVFEINAAPERLDLNEINARKAKEQYGLKLEIGTDSHSVESLVNMRYGVGVARRAWLTKEDVINALPLEEFEEFIHKKTTG